MYLSCVSRDAQFEFENWFEIEIPTQKPESVSKLTVFSLSDYLVAWKDTVSLLTNCIFLAVTQVIVFVYKK